MLECQMCNALFPDQKEYDEHIERCIAVNNYPYQEAQYPQYPQYNPNCGPPAEQLPSTHAFPYDLPQQPAFQSAHSGRPPALPVVKKPLNQCPACDEKFARKRDFLEHSSKLKTCRECDTYFCDITKLKQHYRDEHGVTNVCEKCGKGFKQLANLGHHNASLLRKASKPLACRHCRRPFCVENEYFLHESLCRPLEQARQQLQMFHHARECKRQLRPFFYFIVCGAILELPELFLDIIHS